MKKKGLIHKKSRHLDGNVAHKSIMFSTDVRDQIVKFTRQLNNFNNLVMDPRDNSYVPREEIEAQVGDYEEFVEKHEEEERKHEE